MNARQQAFVEHYLTDLNATQAAIRAGYSEKTAYSAGQRLLKHVEVAPAIAEAQQERSQTVRRDAVWVLQELEATYLHARSINAVGAATTALVHYGKHLGMFNDKLIIEDLREKAQRIAEEYDLDPAEVQREAERWLAAKR